MSAGAVRTTAPMASDADARDDVRRSRGVREIDDATARTIAGWWAGPGHVGFTLARLAQGVEVATFDLLDDIAATRAVYLQNATRGDDAQALDALATWAINH